MTEAARSIQTLQITEAVRDATIGKQKVKHGQTIALDPDEGLVAVSNDRMRCILEAVGKLKPGFELVTVFYGTDAHLDEAEDVAKRIQQSLSGVDVELATAGSLTTATSSPPNRRGQRTRQYRPGATRSRCSRRRWASPA